MSTVKNVSVSHYFSLDKETNHFLIPELGISIAIESETDDILHFSCNKENYSYDKLNSFFLVGGMYRMKFLVNGIDISDLIKNQAKPRPSYFL